jgi:hypothetical protein
MKIEGKRRVKEGMGSEGKAWKTSKGRLLERNERYIIVSKEKAMLGKGMQDQEICIHLLSCSRS